MNSCRIVFQSWFRGCIIEIVVCLLLGGIASSFGGYGVNSQVQTGANANHYTWTVLNQDQALGLGKFAVDVPVETKVLAYNVPPPHVNPYGTAYWMMSETREAQVDPHDGKVWLPASQLGRKWLLWSGRDPLSVCPPGTTATFYLTTDTIAKPGLASGVATTYTPQNDPNYYFSCQGAIIGPATIVTDAATSAATSTSIQTMDAQFPTGSQTNVGSTSVPETSEGAANLSLGLYPGVTVEGVAGKTYGIQYNSDVNDPAGWRGLANVTLIGTKEIWFDPESAMQPHRYYRVVPGPISINP